jgi:hypothetical protein
MCLLYALFLPSCVPALADPSVAAHSFSSWLWVVAPTGCCVVLLHIYSFCHLLLCLPLPSLTMPSYSLPATASRLEIGVGVAPRSSPILLPYLLNPQGLLYLHLDLLFSTVLPGLGL